MTQKYHRASPASPAFTSPKFNLPGCFKAVNLDTSVTAMVSGVRPVSLFYIFFFFLTATLLKPRSLQINKHCREHHRRCVFQGLIPLTRTESLFIHSGFLFANVNVPFVAKLHFRFF